MKRAKRVVKRRANRVMDEVILGLIGLAVSFTASTRLTLASSVTIARRRESSMPLATLPASPSR